MTFFRKILFSTLVLCVIGSGAVCWLDVHSANRTARQVYYVHYQTLGRSLGATFTELERATDTAVLNAEQVFAALRPEQGILNDREQLRSLARRLHVSSLGSFDHEGVSEMFSNSDDRRQRAYLFTLCKDYPQLLNPESAPVVLPFGFKAFKNAEGHAPEKAAMGPSMDGQHILSATFMNQNLSGFLREAISVDSNILRLSLTTQSGGELATAGVSDAAAVAGIEAESAADFADESHATAVLRFRVASSVATCCECFTKGQIQDPSDTSYRLAMTVSLAPLHAAERERRREAWAILGGVILLSAILGFAAARRLVSRIEQLSATTREVLRTGDLTVHTPEYSGHDEMAVLSRGFNTMMRTLQENEKIRAEQASMAAIAKVAAQAAHDIRSPVVALHVVADRGKQLPEELRLLMRDALRRIHDIANNLLTKHPVAVGARKAQPELVAPLVSSALSEQRVARGHQEVVYALDCSPEAHEAFCSVDPVLFRRVLSNLLNNASEAIEGLGTVTVRLVCTDDDLELSIADSGCGIPAERIPEVLAGGNSFGKSEGHGMGLRSAVDALRDWRGELTLTSKVGEGTTVLLRLPLQNAAPWFAHALYLDISRPVLILDDDDAMGRLWAQRLAPLGFSTRAFRSVKAFAQAVREAGAQLGSCLVDFELVGEPRDGLAVVQELGIEASSVLVTSHYDDPQVRQRCLDMGLRIVPKTYAAHVPILAASQHDA